MLFTATDLHVDTHGLMWKMVPRSSLGGLDAQMQGAISVAACCEISITSLYVHGCDPHR